jgi:acyl transferase domain-containing protein
MTDAGSHDNLEGIAILGMAGRFPGANSVDDFWRNLRNGVEAISFFSDEELREAGVDPAQLEAPGYVRARAVLENVELFDARFFGYTPREAEILDPQQRLFLECAWEALEQAGYDPQAYPGKIGVFAGMSASGYLFHNLIGNREALALAGGYQVLISNDKDYLPTRVSYKLNLKGPSVNVQTSCSTSLVAVHLGCQSLLNYQSDIVLAGAVTVAVPQKTGYVYQEGGIASPDGHCRPFDAAAQGTVGGSGIGIVVLKRLEDALADRDTIYAVIKGSAINNDGAEKVGYTAPSVQGQAEVIAEAQAIAGFEPESISYVEAHGTATSIGDPIELKALTQVFRTDTEEGILRHRLG